MEKRFEASPDLSSSSVSLHRRFEQQLAVVESAELLQVQPGVEIPQIPVAVEFVQSVEVVAVFAL